MSRERQKRAIERRLHRRRGASMETRTAINARNAAFTDWTAQCRKCGAKMTGSLVDMTGKCPSCKEVSNDVED